MSAKCTNRRRLGGAWAVAIVLVGVILQAGAVDAQTVARDVTTDTVTSGTVLDASATVSSDMRYVTVGMGAQNSKHTLIPARGLAAAFFTAWGTHVENGTASLTMSVAIDKARRVQKIIIPNKDPKSVVIAPDDQVKKLAETLKIGDAVKFNFMILDKRIYAANVSMVKPVSAESGAAPFTFIGTKSVRVGKQNIMTVTANAGVTPCTFRVPEEIDAKGRSRPVARVADALKKFCRGDLLDLEYKTVNYQFVLTGVKAARKSSQGEIVRVLNGRIRGYEHMGVRIKTDKRTLTLTDPEPVIKLKLKNVSNPSPDPPVQTALKTLKPGDYVMFTYRRQRGVYWLDGIYPASRPDTKSPTQAKGIK
ncbi:MAG: hypothetical protein QGG42_06870 [Phycisphaerae bacterium]|jgi:hypothetical protein|nr:hypothetical protein [Phycisphaerae bacterium]